MISLEFVSVVLLLALAILSPLQVSAQAYPENSLLHYSTDHSSPFSVALESLQKQINYTFESIGLLRRAMTHASFSEENNKALSIFGANVIDASVALRSLVKDVDISAKDLSRRISEISSVDSSCASDGLRLGLQKVIRVSPKTDSLTPAVVCGAFRAMCGAIALDSERSDDAERVFWSVHGQRKGRAISRFLGHMMPLVATRTVTTSCSVEIASMYPCYPYIALPADTRSPSEMCCDIFRESYDIGSARCICLLLSPKIAGVPIDQERVFLLDELCGTSRSLRSICAGPLPPTSDLRGGTPFTTDDDGVADEPAVHHGHTDGDADPSTEGPADVHVDRHILPVYMRSVITVLGLIVVILLFILIRESRRVDSADTHSKVC